MLKEVFVRAEEKGIKIDVTERFKVRFYFPVCSGLFILTLVIIYETDFALNQDHLVPRQDSVHK